MSRTGFDRRDVVALAVGGVAGAALRWLVTEPGTGIAEGGWFAYEPNTAVTIDGPGFPWRTLTVNVLGCLLLGVVLALRRRELGPPRLLLAAGTGFCGSLTTFSTFAIELTTYLRGAVPPRGPVAVNVADAPTSPGRAITYLLVSAAAGAIAFVAGRRAVVALTPPPSP